jgi:hypothetical protein
MELFVCCLYYNRVLGGGCFYDLVDNTLVSHVKWLASCIIWYMLGEVTVEILEKTSDIKKGQFNSFKINFVISLDLS